MLMLGYFTCNACVDGKLHQIQSLQTVNVLILLSIIPWNLYNSVILFSNCEQFYKLKMKYIGP